MPANIICYPDGAEARVGDIVREHGDTLMVEDVVTEPRLAEFGVDVAGLMLAGLPYGHFFASVDHFVDEDGGLFFVASQA